MDDETFEIIKAGAPDAPLAQGVTPIRGHYKYHPQPSSPTLDIVVKQNFYYCKT